MRVALRPRPTHQRTLPALAASALALACSSAASAARAALTSEDSAPATPATPASGDKAPEQATATPEEKRPARPPLPPPPPPVRLPWDRTLELGADVALVFRPASLGADDQPSTIRYEPAIGFGFHARWEIFRYLRFNAYLLGASHGLRVPDGALGQPGAVESDAVDTFTFGARLAPTLPLGDRARCWASLGIGYGRFNYPRMTIHEPGMDPYQVRERAMSFMDIPAGIGVSYDVIRDWLTVELEVLGSLALGQEGESVRGAQAIDALGHKRSIGGLPLIDASFVQTLGLSIIL